MKRALPKSLLGQVMLALATALLIAQGISGALLYRAAEQRRETALVHFAASQLVSGERRENRREQRADRSGDDTPDVDRNERRGPPPEFRRNDDARPFRIPRRLRYVESEIAPILPGETRNAKREEALAEVLASHGLALDEVVVVERSAEDDPLLREEADRLSEMRLMAGPDGARLMVAAVRQAGSAQWQVSRMPIDRANRMPLVMLALQTFIMFAVLVGLMYFVLRRITGPLHALAERTQRFAGAGQIEPPLEPTGPEDVSRLIAAHNAMQARIGAMLDEKDVMLGAIGHDLKTPIAALRVRIESVEDPAARSKMVDSIEDITRTLDEILALARVGRADAPPERTDIGALVASVVEEFEDMGEPVGLLDFERTIAPVHLTWLKRGLRNLLSNALRYGGSAEVSVLHEAGQAILRVDDYGPGIPEDRIADMLEPFTRGEGSRNRATGGAGLGLTLARAVAEQYGGALVLANRAEGGLRAEIRIPL